MKSRGTRCARRGFLSNSGFGLLADSGCRQYSRSFTALQALKSLSIGQQL
jgi:hypothetical protein